MEQCPLETSCSLAVNVCAQNCACASRYVCMHVRLKFRHVTAGFYGALGLSLYLVAMNAPPQVCCIISQYCCVAAQATAVFFPVLPCLLGPCRPSWLLSSVISLCQICAAASAYHSLGPASSPPIHCQHDPSPQLQGAEPPLLIVLRREDYQDLNSPVLLVVIR